MHYTGTLLGSVISVGFVLAAQHTLTPKSTTDIVNSAFQATAIVEADDSWGAGWFINPKGDFLTAHHVIADAAGKIKVHTSDGKEHVAVIAFDDPQLDITILKMADIPTSPYIPWGNSKKTQVGDRVVEIGDPFNVGMTVTQGIVSSLKGKDSDMIQYDAPTNPGNSGGVVLNESGEAIGMCDQIFAMAGPFSQPQSAGLAFAVPAQTIIRRLRLLDFLHT